MRADPAVMGVAMLVPRMKASCGLLQSVSGGFLHYASILKMHRLSYCYAAALWRHGLQGMSEQAWSGDASAWEIAVT